MPVRAILAFVAACAVGKLFAAWATGFAGDEAYTAVISRTLALSYFDHPPLHQWIVHAFAAVAGEGWWLRLPFVLIIAGINVPLYGLTLQAVRSGGGAVDAIRVQRRNLFRGLARWADPARRAVVSLSYQRHVGGCGSTVRPAAQ